MARHEARQEAKARHPSGARQGKEDDRKKKPFSPSPQPCSQYITAEKQQQQLPLFLPPNIITTDRKKVSLPDLRCCTALGRALKVEIL